MRSGARAAGLVLALLVAGCAGGGRAGGGEGQGSAAGCDPLPLRAPGALTVGWNRAAGEPWFVGDPAEGRGFEAALVVEVAGRLGLDPSDITWVALPLAQAFEPGEKPFDLYVGGVVALPERETRADLSRGYFRLDQAVVAPAGAEATAARLADLRGLVLGGLAGQRGLAVIDLLIRPDRRPFAYRGPAEAAAALRAGEVGAVLMDLPAAVALAAEDPGVQVVGRVVTGEQYVLVFPGGSRLRPCVDAVLAELRADGTLRRLAREWLPAYRGIPVLPAG